ncbi:MAG: hypothetical protein H6741_14545 [Alphaproteobacteria bacterium]|nr:hypothetical protein [Alphaproteobacteria bacterium]
MWLLLAMTALATPPPGRVSAARFGPEHGLPGAQVRALALEDAGTLLVGTEAGACRFDGQRCEALPAPEGMERAFVSGIHARGGSTWVSTALGVFRVDGEQATLLDSHVLSVFRSAFVHTPEGALLLVDEAGVWRVEELGLTRLVGPEAGWGWEAAWHEGRVYLGGPEGLFALEGEALTRLGQEPVRGLLPAPEGLLVGTTQGLRDLDGQPLPEGTDCFVTDLARLPGGRRVVACGRGVQVEAQGGGWEPVDEESGLPTAIVLQAAVDRDGQLWLGSLDQGLIRVAEPDVRLWDLSTGLPSPHITALARQGEDLLVATRQGGLRLSPDQRWTLEQPGELRSVAVDAEGRALWLDAQALLHRAGAAPLQVGEALGMLHRLPDGRLLHHAHEAAWLLDPAAAAPLARFELPQDVIDASGVLDGEAFYAVGVEGLWRVDAEGFTRAGEGPGRCGGSIAGLGARGLYVACDARLFLREGEGWRALPEAGEAIKGLARSGEELWLSTLTSLRRLEPTPLRLDAGSGLPAVSFTGATGPMRWGEWLVAPTGQGLLFVRPDALGRAREAPTPRIRAVYVGDLELSDLSQLKPGDRLLRLHLGSDSLVDPAALRYRFRLDGGEWSPAFSSETLHLPGLAHGPHALEVQVRFTGGPWSAQAAALSFTVPPLWHQRRDVQGVALAGLLALLGLAWRERTRRLTEQLRRLEEQESFRQVFGRFVDPRVAERALAGTLNREGEKREVTVLFVDLRGFTPLSEALAPRQLVALLNAWLTAMVEQVEAEGGVVNKFAGDAIVAIFGAPLAQEDHADRALRAAGAMREATHALNVDLERRLGRAIAAGIGLNSGEVIAGPIGAESRMEYTVIGEAVNVAARVESLTRALDVEVLITEATRARLGGDFPLEPKGAHRLKGVGEPVEVWALSPRGPGGRSS